MLIITIISTAALCSLQTEVIVDDMACTKPSMCMIDSQTSKATEAQAIRVEKTENPSNDDQQLPIFHNAFAYLEEKVRLKVI